MTGLTDNELNAAIWLSAAVLVFIWLCFWTYLTYLKDREQMNLEFHQRNVFRAAPSIKTSVDTTKFRQAPKEHNPISEEESH